MANSEGYVKEIKLFLVLFNMLGIYQNNAYDNRLPRTWWSGFICFFWLIFFLLYLCYYIYIFCTTKKISINAGVDNISNVLTLLSVIADMIFSHFSQNHILKFFEKMDEYDEEVKKIKCSRKDNYRFLWTYWIFIIVWIVIAIITLTEERATNLRLYSLPILIPLTIALMIQIHCCLKFVIMVYAILQRFRHFNNIITNKFCTNTTYNSATMTINDVKNLHFLLSKGIHYLIKVYGNLLFIWLSGLVVNVLILTYQALNLLSVTSAITAVIIVFQIFSLCAICHYTVQEGKRSIVNIIAHTFSVLRSDVTVDKLEVMVYFLHNETYFSAAEFFQVDFTLMHSVVSAIATYLMVLLQST